MAQNPVGPKGRKLGKRATLENGNQTLWSFQTRNQTQETTKRCFRANRWPRRSPRRVRRSARPSWRWPTWSPAARSASDDVGRRESGVEAAGVWAWAGEGRGFCGSVSFLVFFFVVSMDILKAVITLHSKSFVLRWDLRAKEQPGIKRG